MRSEALPEGTTALKAGTRVEFGIAQGRAATRRSRSAILDPPASVVRNQSQAKRKKPEEMVPIVEDLIRLLDGVGEAYRHGRHPERPRPPSRPPSCCARWRTSSSSDGPIRRAGPAAGSPAYAGSALTEHEQRPRDEHDRGGDQPERAALASGSAMPTKPPITHASWSVVSLRANALVLHALGHVALDRRVERQLGQRLGEPGDEAEQAERAAAP